LGETITLLAELGVLLLMFIAGLELHLSDLAQSGKTAVLAGIMGFITPLAMGFALAMAFSFDPHQAIFIGLILAPTSVSISAQTLMELDVLRSKVGVSLLGAAVVDDLLVVLGVSLFLALVGSSAVGGLTSELLILLKMVLYLVIASALGLWLLPKLSLLIEKLPISQGLIAFTFVIVLFYAWAAEALGHMAMIIGAFLAGLLFARSSFKGRIEEGFSPLAYGVFVPIFFVGVGLSADLRQLSTAGIWLLVAMFVVAVISKVFGVGLAGRFGGFTNREAVQLGVGMVPRGEVVLIVITVGITEGLIGSDIFSAAVGMVVLATLVAPVMLRSLFPKPTPAQLSADVSSYEERHQV
jgi:Kef-type K+ transport system membrane component KefB